MLFKKSYVLLNYLIVSIYQYKKKQGQYREQISIVQAWKEENFKELS